MEQRNLTYSRRERFWLWTLAAFGLFGVNGAFLYGALIRPEALRAALLNPVSAAFMAEALVLLGVLAYLFHRWQVLGLSWRWFVVLSLAGSLAFSIPLGLLWRRR